ncbi:hypothetical protein D3C81_318240 [compost metagenome]
MLETAVYARLQDLASGRVFAGVAPLETPTPRLSYAVVSEPFGFVLGGADGSSTPSIQVDIWAASRLEALQVGTEVIAALGAETEAFCVVGLTRLADETDEATGLERVAYEFTLAR